MDDCYRQTCDTKLASTRQITTVLTLLCHYNAEVLTWEVGISNRCMMAQDACYDSGLFMQGIFLQYELREALTAITYPCMMPQHMVNGIVSEVKNEMVRLLVGRICRKFWHDICMSTCTMEWKV